MKIKDDGTWQGVTPEGWIDGILYRLGLYCIDLNYAFQIYNKHNMKGWKTVKEIFKKEQ